MPRIWPNLHTQRFTESTITVDDLNRCSRILIAGNPSELRGKIPIWNDVIFHDPTKIIWIDPCPDQKSITLRSEGKDDRIVSLRNEGQLDELVGEESVLLDISGLPHYIWTPILKSINRKTIPLTVLYAEPDSYKFHPTPASDTLFDLTARFRGMAPLPGMANLAGPKDGQATIFVGLIGFEGNRPESLLFQIESDPIKVVPIVGVPGFKFNFPTYTVTCNRNFLMEYCSHSETRFARASCPFEAYETLEKIHQDFSGSYMYIAPVGTKPHSLGAMLYAIHNRDKTEIVYDNPVRKDNRTKGIGVIHLYNFSTSNGS